VAYSVIAKIVGVLLVVNIHFLCGMVSIPTHEQQLHAIAHGKLTLASEVRIGKGGHGSAIGAMAMLSDGEHVAVQDLDLRLTMWHIPSQRTISTLSGGREFCVMADCDDKPVIVTLGGDNAITIFDAHTLELLHKIENAYSTRWSMGRIIYYPFGSFGQHLLLTTGKKTKMVSVWDVKHHVVAEYFYRLGADAPIDCRLVLIDNEPHLLVGTLESGINTFSYEEMVKEFYVHVLNLKTGSYRQMLRTPFIRTKAHTSIVGERPFELIVSHNNHYFIVLSKSGTMVKWGLQALTESPIASVTIPDYVRGSSLYYYQGTDYIILANTVGDLDVWDMDTMRHCRTIKTGLNKPRLKSWLERYVIAFTMEKDGLFKIYDFETGRCLHTHEHEAKIMDIIPGPHGSLITGDHKGGLQLWNFVLDEANS